MGGGENIKCHWVFPDMPVASLIPRQVTVKRRHLTRLSLYSFNQTPWKAYGHLPEGPRPEGKDLCSTHWLDCKQMGCIVFAARSPCPRDNVLLVSSVLGMQIKRALRTQTVYYNVTLGNKGWAKWLLCGLCCTLSKYNLYCVLTPRYS